MADISGGDLNRIEMKLIKVCPECSDEIRWFMYGLTEVDSLVEVSLESLGFHKFKLDEARRTYQYSLNCGGDIQFMWKDRQVSNLEIFCEHDEQSAKRQHRES